MVWSVIGIRYKSSLIIFEWTIKSANYQKKFIIWGFMSKLIGFIVLMVGLLLKNLLLSIPLYRAFWKFQNIATFSFMVA